MAARWVVATGNRGKLAEIAALLTGRDLELVAQTDLGVGPVEETGATFVENALIKARHAAAHSGLPAIADDSGLVVDALDGEPGVRSARYAGPDADDLRNVDRLLEALRDVPADRRTAHFHCTIVVLRYPRDPAPVITAGTWSGVIAAEPAGSHGFGYDPVFFDPRLGRTAAQLAPDIKNEVSHRGAAMRALAGRLDELL